MPHSKKHDSAAAFRARVLAVARRVPRGKVASYAAVARAAGFPRHARAVGNIMQSNYDPSIPCHRIVRTDGRVGGYNRGGWNKKAERLRREGIPVNPHGRIPRGYFISP